MSLLITSVISAVFLLAAHECSRHELYIGCYADIKYENKTQRHDMEDEAISYLEINLVETCIKSCRNRGFKYAGCKVYSCYCGDKFGRMGKRADSACAGRCGKNPCGSDCCNAIYRVCPFGKFGMDCNNTCNCANKKEPCGALTGECPVGGCADGWLTKSCSIRDKCVDVFGCKNGGTCTHDRFKISFLCLCPPPFRGLHCEDSCPVGYYGDDCVNICQCAVGSCHIKTGVCEGKCKLGFFGPNCGNYDPCVTNPCKNNGICRNSEGQYGCRCQGPFYGHNCEFDTRSNASLSKFAALPPAWRLKQMVAFSEYQVKRMAKENIMSYTYEYIGCFRDQDVDRDLDDDLWIDENMGPAACSRHCLRKGFTFAGIQAGTDCRCGNTFGRHGIVPIGKCGIVCANEPLQKCGAEDLNSMYSVCPAGRYEPSCKATCNCMADVHCDLMTGVCSDLLCNREWTGRSCNEVIVNDEWNWLLSALIKSVETYAIATAALTLWTGYQWKKKRKSSKIVRIQVDQELTETAF